MALLACAQLLHSQNLKDSLAAPGLKSLLKLKLSADFGLEWEKRISAVSSISLFGGCSFGRQSNDFAEYRNYYNLQKRRKSNKITRNNAANFLFGRIESVFAVNGLNSFNLLFIQGWGIQRNIDRKILVGYHAGILEHFYFDKPVTGGFHYVKIEPLNSFSVTLIF